MHLSKFIWDSYVLALIPETVRKTPLGYGWAFSAALYEAVMELGIKSAF